MPPEASNYVKPAESGKRPNHYYVAVGSPAVKLITLVELLRAFEEGSHFGVAVCCRSRDTLDLMLHGLMQEGFHPPFVACLHSDMGERERREVLHDFKAILAGDRPPTALRGDSSSAGGLGVSPTTEFLVDTGIIQQPHDEHAESWGGSPGADAPLAGPCVLAVTDVCLKATQRELQSLGLRLLINYDLPARKDIYQRRIATLFGSRGRRGGRGGTSTAPPGAGGSSSSSTPQGLGSLGRSPSLGSMSAGGGGFLTDATGGSPLPPGGAGGGRAIVHMVAAGEAQAFREVEAYEARPIVEVPVCVADMLTAIG